MRSAPDATSRAVEADHVGRIGRLLGDWRIERIRPDDLRFGWRGPEETMPAWLRRLAAQRVLLPEDATRLRVLESALQMTMGEDVRDLARTLGRLAYGSATARARGEEVFLTRFGGSTASPKAADIAIAMGCTRQRVDQIVGRMIAARGDSSVASPAAAAVLRRAMELQTSAASEMELALALGLVPGNGHSLTALRAYCKRVLALQQADIDALGTELSAAPARLPQVHSSARMPTIEREALRRCRAFGAAHVAAIAGDAMLANGVNCTRAELEQALERIPSMRWLDRDEGWLTIDCLEKTFLYKRVREMLAVARDPMDPIDVLAGMMRLARSPDSSGGAFAAPPVHVFREMVTGWAGITTDGRGQLMSTSELDPEALLPEVQRQIYRILKAGGGLARKSVVTEGIESTCAKSTVLVHIAQTAFIYALNSDYYALRGWRLTDQAVLAAHAGATPDDMVIVVKRPPQASHA